jgi:hypothetical protein
VAEAESKSHLWNHNDALLIQLTRLSSMKHTGLWGPYSDRKNHSSDLDGVLMCKFLPESVFLLYSSDMQDFKRHLIIL